MDTLKVYLTQDEYLGNAKGKIMLNGAVLGEVTVMARRGTASQEFKYEGSWGPGPHRLRIEFTNNAYGGTPDKNRNLIVNSYDYNGVTVAVGDTIGNNGHKDYTILAPVFNVEESLKQLISEVTTGFKRVIEGQLALTAIVRGGDAGVKQPVPAPTPKPPSGPELADMPVTPGKLILLPAATMYKAKHFEPVDCPLIVEGAGMRKTVLHGKGGVGSGNRLAWGKGFVHTKGPASFADVGFEDCGRHDGKSDGETSVYAEDFAEDGTLSFLRCAFDWNENGVFTPNPPQGARINVHIESSVFGRKGPNGADDGLSHDIYVAGKSLYVGKSVFVGNAKGNTIKSRSASILVEDSYIGRTNGRWIDAPCASTFVSRRNEYVTQPGAESANALGLFDEADNRHPGGGTFRFEGDKFYFSRENGEVIWLPDARTIATFDQCAVFWVGAKGSRPPNVELRGPGKVIGLDLTMNEGNRVDVAPPVPPDPVA